MNKKDYLPPQVETVPVKIEVNIMSYQGGAPNYDPYSGSITWEP